MCNKSLKVKLEEWGTIVLPSDNGADIDNHLTKSVDHQPSS